jgi:hypothetical protein
MGDGEIKNLWLYEKLIKKRINNQLSRHLDTISERTLNYTICKKLARERTLGMFSG